MVKRIFNFGMLFCLSSICVIILYTYANRNANAKNGFRRTFYSDEAKFVRQEKIEKDLYSIAGITPNLITIYKFRKPYELLKITPNLEDKQLYKLSFELEKKKFDGMNSVTFSDSATYLLSGRTSIAYRTFSRQKRSDSSKLDSLPFYQSQMINPNSFIFISKVKHEGLFRRMLKKVNWQGKQQSNYLPEKQLDGYFCTDGLFDYDKNSQRLIYMYYYRGEFTCLDTNLNIIYRANTIDTVRNVNMRLSPTFGLANKKIKGVSQSTPPKIINRRFCMANDKVFIQSYLKADNEDADDFRDSEVIDVYDLNSGRYSASFYLPKLEKQKLTEFKIHKNILVGLYGNNILAIFNIPNRIKMSTTELKQARVNLAFTVN